MRDSGEGEACTILPGLQNMGWYRYSDRPLCCSSLSEGLPQTGEPSGYWLIQDPGCGKPGGKISVLFHYDTTQFERARDSLEAEGGRLVTMSAGNYGRSLMPASHPPLPLSLYVLPVQVLCGGGQVLGSRGNRPTTQHSTSVKRGTT